MKTFPAPQILIRQLLQSPHVVTVAAFAVAGIFLGIAGWFLHRNLCHNEPGLRTPLRCFLRSLFRPSGCLARTCRPRLRSIGGLICAPTASKKQNVQLVALTPAMGGVPTQSALQRKFGDFDGIIVDEMSYMMMRDATQVRPVPQRADRRFPVLQKYR